jgi:hypothetical protein
MKQINIILVLLLVTISSFSQALMSNTIYSADIRFIGNDTTEIMFLCDLDGEIYQLDNKDNPKFFKKSNTLSYSNSNTNTTVYTWINDNEVQTNIFCKDIGYSNIYVIYTIVKTQGGEPRYTYGSGDVSECKKIE